MPCIPLTTIYPWTSHPLIVSAPLRPYATEPLACAVSLAGGLGFLSYIPGQTERDLDAVRDLLKDKIIVPSRSGASDPSPSSAKVSPQPQAVLPVGIGYLIHSAPLATAAQHIRVYRPAAIWLFAPHATRASGSLRAWAAMARRESRGATTVWVQVGSVAGALHAVAECCSSSDGDEDGNSNEGEYKNKDKQLTLVVQGNDAGGHGLAAGAGIVSLLPEVLDVLEQKGWLRGGRVRCLAAGGIVEARGAAAAMALGAEGVVLGTRMLGSEELARVAPPGFSESVLRASDGGQSTFRTSLFDRLRGTALGGETGWPDEYDARGLRNASSRAALEEGMPFDEVKKLFDEHQREGKAERFGEQGRDVTYAGTGVGLVRRIMPAKEIVEEVRNGILEVLERTCGRVKASKL